ncbi:MAG: hypothetical protein QOD83_1785 [Solirubrobacteraceae bacterium]|jgi:hypothetical protein|nr:hypothetical protein [Solirubrobacteraceae bacterium]
MSALCHRVGMATLAPDDDSLLLRLSTLEKLGALHGDIRAALSAVQAIDAVQNPFRELRGIRAPGNGLPGQIALGTWRYRGGKDFVAIYRGKPGVIVRLRGTPFQRLLVSADEPDAMAACIRSALP